MKDSLCLNGRYRCVAISGDSFKRFKQANLLITSVIGQLLQFASRGIGGGLHSVGTSIITIISIIIKTIYYILYFLLCQYCCFRHKSNLIV